MATRTRRNTGFTLVEILIVVVILGILAAIVIPQFTNASEDAKSSSLYTQLQTIRSQLELYQIQHNGAYPTLAQLQNDTGGGTGDQWGVMINKTNVSGTIDAANEFGPYMQQPPKNPFTNKSTVVTGTAYTADLDDGWVYDATTGSIWACGFDEATGTYSSTSGS